MGATAAAHPTDPILQAYGLGKLDDISSSSVSKHLEGCDPCLHRVSELSSDDFLGRLRNAQGHPGPSGPIVSSLTGLSVLDSGADSSARLPNSSLPPGLADHPVYEVIRELGQGGMGTVYLAQNRLMGRHEVLKVVSSHLNNRRGVLDRFLGEIRNAARLHHTNIVTAYSAMPIGENIVFSMEFVDGLDLARLVKARGPLPIANVSNYGHQAALGLQHAHEHGMVHRDIKPGNLMLAKRGDRAIIKVLDFGLAKVKSEGAVDGGLTHEGQMLGTPDYIAPEQIGDAKRADIRADIYSLGCTLYYLLTGGPPFHATSLYQVLQAHHSMDALPLNLARPEVPVELAALVARMMSKEPERRFQTPKEVAQALLPFFKRTAVGDTNSNAEISTLVRAEEGRASPAARFASTQPATASSDQGTPLGASAASQGEPIWKSLIEVSDSDLPTSALPRVSNRSQRHGWTGAALAALAVLVVTVGTLAGVLVFRTKYGAIVLKDVPENAEASFEDEQGTLKLPGRRDPIEFKALPGGRQLQLTSGDTVVTGESVSIGVGGEKPINAQLDPRVEAGRPQTDLGRFANLFNGTDKRGWTESVENKGEWKVVGGTLFGIGGEVRGQPGILISERKNFSNFRLRIKVRYVKEQAGRIVIRHSYSDNKMTGYGIFVGNGAVIDDNAVPPGSIQKLSDVPFDQSWTCDEVAAIVALGVAEPYTLEITAKGNRIVTSINDKKVAEFTDPNDGPVAGEILLWSAGASTVEYQEILIEEL